MKERGVMGSFLAGHLVDSAVSYYYLALNGWRDIGGLGSSHYLQLGETDKLVIAKLGVVAAVIGMYALAKEHSIKYFEPATEKAIKIGNAAVWTVRLWNVFNIIGNAVLTRN